MSGNSDMKNLNDLELRLAIPTVRPDVAELSVCKTNYYVVDNKLTYLSAEVIAEGLPNLTSLYIRN